MVVVMGGINFSLLRTEDLIVDDCVAAVLMSACEEEK